MNRKLLIATLVSAALASTAYAAPPEGKGNPGHSGKGNSQVHGQGKSNAGGKGQGNGNAHRADKGNSDKVYRAGGRHDGDGYRGSVRGGSGTDVLIRAGITLATARSYASEYGYHGYSPLPPGIRKNLARGKPLPPGIAKKLVPGPMLARLPHYDGYEWRIAGRDLILVALGTAIIADVLFDVF
ncbi:hypothetical protein GSY71_14805 [Pusillimonas sp. TS35]|uniref:anti-virulence regulator CigR family protein n=1 Tax=Paracandidimonas lactea TaxID=2895524 RepID=UPI0013712668|nr:anti-virulence regulator CigR family protein [Paracandidimonas lactea]MYN14409.1 hypothetical protein [Pusillimonas sp. TS35]